MGPGWESHPLSAAPTGLVDHLYVHVPFCRTRCGYCDFASEPLAAHVRSGAVEAYVEAVLRELEFAGSWLSRPLATLYVGGGTPTTLPRPALLRLLAGLAALVGPNTEFTVEANPESVEPTLLDELAGVGVTRLSLGVQSFSPVLRGNLGRRTPLGAVAAAVRTVREVGWPEWSLDVVFGIPGQDTVSLEADLEAAVSAGPPHISVYDLTYTEAFAKSIERRLGQGERERAEEFADEAYAGVSESLARAGYARYEVSNYARPGHESRHNLAYWRGCDYVGLGASAVGTVGMTRWTNPRGVTAYLEGQAPDVEVLSPELRRLERVMLGLRTAEGVSDDEAAGVVHSAEVERLLALGLLERRYATLRMSPRGLDLGNAVLAAVLRSPEEISPVPGRSHSSTPRV